MAVPEGRNAARFRFAGQSVACSGDDPGGIGANKKVCAFGNGDGPLGVFPQGEARDAKSGGLFLDAARVREDKSRFAEEAEKIEIADRRDEAEFRTKTNSGLREALLGARVDRKNDGNIGGYGVDGA